MTPRRYRLGRRAESTAATRDAILDAAVAVYRDAGIEGATLKAIAARADVSRGTILHHFGNAEGLLDAALDRILTSLDLPDERILDGIIEPEARVRMFVGAMVAFFRRSTPWWQVFQSEMGRPAVQAREAQYWSALGRLQAAALGPAFAADAAIQGAVGAVLHPGTVGNVLWVLESAGTSPAEAERVIEDLVVGFLDVRAEASSGAGERREAS